MESKTRIVKDWQKDPERPDTFTKVVERTINGEFCRIISRISQESYDLLMQGNELVKAMIDRDVDKMFDIAAKNRT